MNKAEFTRIAPKYYSAAIMVYLFEHGGAPVSRQGVSSYYHDADLNWYYLRRDRLLDLAITWLRDEGIVDLTSDPFGPLIISASVDFNDRWRQLSQDVDFPLFKYSMISDGDGWLRDALRTLEANYSRLEITDEDFDETDKEWEPLPLEREDPHLLKAIEALDDTVEKVRTDNGYAANLPEERQYVLDCLSALSKTLKEYTTVSISYLRTFAFSPLSKLLTRFRGAAIGLAASVAKEALRDWLRRKGVSLLDDLFP